MSSLISNMSSGSYSASSTTNSFTFNAHSVSFVGLIISEGEVKMAPGLFLISPVALAVRRFNVS